MKVVKVLGGTLKDASTKPKATPRPTTKAKREHTSRRFEAQRRGVSVEVERDPRAEARKHGPKSAKQKRADARAAREYIQGPDGKFQGSTGSGKSEGAKGDGPKSTAPTTSTSHAEFHEKFESAFKDSPYSAMVSHYSVAEMRDANMQPLTANDGKTGLLITDHGDGRIEAMSLYNVSDVPGAGVALLRDAIENHGVNYVECYGPYLNTIYEGLGFVDSDTAAFDPSMAASDWNSERFDEPDYHMMRLQ